MVLDYGRERLYLADVTDVPPHALGPAADPVLRVSYAMGFDPETDAIEPITVAPEFDILVPAFDWAETDDGWEPPRPRRQSNSTGSPAGSAIGG